MKKIIYIDMDNVLVDFPSAFAKLDQSILDAYPEDRDDIPGIFALMAPMDGAIDAYEELAKVFDVYILSTSPWANPSAWSDKLEWVKKHLGEVAYKRLILTHNKHLNKGDYLIDDRTKNGASEFEGELIQFGSEKFPDWSNVLSYLLPPQIQEKTFAQRIGEEMVANLNKNVLESRNDEIKIKRIRSDEHKRYMAEMGKAFVDSLNRGAQEEEKEAKKN